MLNEKNTNKITEAENAAKNEGRITSLQLLVDIEPLLKEYFIADIALNGNSIDVCFKNGQCFKLCASEIC